MELQPRQVSAREKEKKNKEKLTLQGQEVKKGKVCEAI